MNTFQRESILALQSTVSDLVKSVYDEQDRMLLGLEKTQCWPVRQWEARLLLLLTDTEMRLEMRLVTSAPSHPIDSPVTIRKSPRTGAKHGRCTKRCELDRCPY